MDNYLIEIIDRIGKKIETSPLKKRTHYVIDGEVLYLDEVNHQDHTTLWSYKEYEVKIWYHGGETRALCTCNYASRKFYRWFDFPKKIRAKIHTVNMAIFKPRIRLIHIHDDEFTFLPF